MHAHVPAGVCGCVSAAALRGSAAALDVDMPVFRACKPVLQMRLPIWMGQELAERRRGRASFMVQCSFSVWVRRRERRRALLARHCRAPCCPRLVLHSIHNSVFGYQRRAGQTLQSHAFSSNSEPFIDAWRMLSEFRGTEAFSDRTSFLASLTLRILFSWGKRKVYRVGNHDLWVSTSVPEKILSIIINKLN